MSSRPRRAPRRLVDEIPTPQPSRPKRASSSSSNQPRKSRRTAARSSAAAAPAQLAPPAATFNQSEAEIWMDRLMPLVDRRLDALLDRRGITAGSSATGQPESPSGSPAASVQSTPAPALPPPPSPEILAAQTAARIAGEVECIQKCLVSGFFANAAQLHYSGEYHTVRDGHPLHIHPTSVLFSETPSQWIMYNEVVHTTKEFMRDITVIKPEWLYELAPHYYEFGTMREKAEKRMKRS